MTLGLKRIIKNEAINILGPWFTKHEIEACFVAILGFCQGTRKYLHFFEKWVVQPFQNVSLSCLSKRYDPN